METKPASTFEPRRIFVPVDFSDPSREALSAAVALARRLGSRLAVAHVARGNRPDSHIVAEQMGVTFDTRRAGRGNLAEFLKRELPPGLQPTRIVTAGVPFDEITKAAAAWEADLIVIATHGDTGLKQVLLGSTTERVVRQASCPVLVVRGRDKREAATAFSPDQVRSILVPVDFAKSSLKAVSYAVALARKYDAQLVLLHVVEPFHADLFIDTSGTQRAARASAHQFLKQLVETTRKTWPRTGHELRSGHAVTVITALAKRTGADLIVVGTHGRTGLQRRFLGSVAERVVRHAPCPVLVVR
jgi:nucleotide-binding universal stress UspA family protein